MTDEGVQVTGPQLPVRPQPRVELPERSRLEPVDALLGGGAGGDEPCFAQHSEVLGDGGLTHPQPTGQITDAALAPPQLVDYATAGGLGESAEDVHVADYATVVI